jgi:hypothetical protein
MTVPAAIWLLSKYFPGYSPKTKISNLKRNGAPAMKSWLILINDFTHDLLTGLWFGTFVTLIVLRGKVGDPVLLGDLNHIFTALCLASLIGITLSGIFRFFYYRNLGRAELAAINKRLLRIKHALLGSLMLGGTGVVIAWAL